MSRRRKDIGSGVRGLPVPTNGRIQKEGLILNFFNRLICLMICLIFIQSCNISTAVFDEYDNTGDSHMTVTGALNQKRLTEIHNSPKIIGTGGSPVSLPNGIVVNRDIIFKAIQPLIKQGYSVCPDLLAALKSDHVHVRYGACMALESITKAEIPYYPFFPKNHPKNLEGYEKLKNHIMKCVMQTRYVLFHQHFPR